MITVLYMFINKKLHISRLNSYERGLDKFADVLQMAFSKVSVHFVPTFPSDNNS